MSEIEEVVDQDEGKKASGGLKAVAVFTYLGKGILLLLAIGFLVGMFVSEEYMVNKIKDADQSSEGWVLGTKILCLVYIVSSVGALIGVSKMKKGKKQGFYIYALSNLLLIGFMVYNANIVELIFSAVLAFFIILYVPFLRKLS